ncbi:MAG: hypothetical protein QHC65_04205 [Sphingomonas sp.]|nr:hypothetical protein [Sphingomonas sp.]MDX3883601.1 hypothetical protein [Sphingomonas sp.]
MDLNDSEDLAADLLGGGSGGGEVTAEPDGGAAGGGDGGSGGDGGAGGGAGDFLAMLSGEGGDADNPSNRDWIQAKGFKDLDALVKSYREAERVVRSGARVVLPGAEAKPEEIAAFRAAIGVPEKAADYQFQTPEGVQLNEPMMARLSEAALKHGLPKAAFEGVVADYIQAQLDEAHEERTRQDGLAAAKLKEWGAQKDERMAQVTTAMRHLGLSAADGGALRSALGADRAMEILAKLGAGMSEDTLLTGGKGRFGVSPAEAQAELDRLKGDPDFVKKAVQAGTPENLRWKRLNQAAAEGKAQQEI